MAKQRTNRTPTAVRTLPDWAPKFLAQLSLCGTIREAAQKARISRSTVYERRDSDPEFATAMAHALEDADDRLEEMGHRRARKSDKLLMYLLTVRRYNKRRLEVSGPDGAPVPLAFIEVGHAESDADGGAQRPAGAAPELPPRPAESLGQ